MMLKVLRGVGLAAFLTFWHGDVDAKVGSESDDLPLNPKPFAIQNLDSHPRVVSQLIPRLHPQPQFSGVSPRTFGFTSLSQSSSQQVGNIRTAAFKVVPPTIPRIFRTAHSFQHTNVDP